MTTTTLPPLGADQIYRIGPETLAAQSTTILAGQISHYSKQVLSKSQPGEETIPLKWIVSGELDQPEILKGPSVKTPVLFSRQEQSMILPRDISMPDWELQYGEFQQGDWAVIFVQSDPAHAVVTLPSGAGDRDLISLIRNIVAIQSNSKGPQTQAWLLYLTKADDGGRETALRSLMNGHVQWSELAPAVEHLMADATLSSRLRAFIFGAAAFGITHGLWPDDSMAIADFLCRVLIREQHSSSILQYVLQVRQILSYAYAEPFREKRSGLRRRLIQCLKQVASQSSEIEQQYREILAQYPQ